MGDIVDFRRAWSDKDRELVRALACLGAPVALIARVLRCSVEAVEDGFRSELETALTHANARVLSALLRAAESGSVQAQVFWLKARAGLTDTAPAASLDEMADEAPERAAELFQRMADKLRSRG